MQTFNVKMRLVAHVVYRVEAKNEQEAKHKARALAATKKIPWEFTFEDVSNGSVKTWPSNEEEPQNDHTEEQHGQPSEPASNAEQSSGRSESTPDSIPNDVDKRTPENKGHAQHAKQRVKKKPHATGKRK